MSGRRSQILDTAERRFLTSGYLGCSIADIIDELGIAKGTFYHHFPSKEAVMLAVIDRHIDRLKNAMMPIAMNSDIPATDRLSILLAGGTADQAAPNDIRREGGRDLAAELESPGNEHFHATAMSATTRALTPVLAHIFADGVSEGTFHLADPTATAAAFLVVTSQLVDGDLMGWCQRDDTARLSGLMAAAEQLLGIDSGTLTHLLTNLNQRTSDAHS